MSAQCLLPDPPAFSFGPINQTDLVRYAGASGDFNPLHHDETFAREAGLPSIMAHGMFSAGLLGSFLAAWASERPVRRYKVRFGAPVWLGDTLKAEGKVLNSEQASGTIILRLGLCLFRQDGAEVVSGEAEIECAGSETDQERAGGESS